MGVGVRVDMPGLVPDLVGTTVATAGLAAAATAAEVGAGADVDGRDVDSGCADWVPVGTGGVTAPWPPPQAEIVRTVTLATMKKSPLILIKDKF